ncbi:MAG: hypothetical protein KAS32_24455, partial [Candidatus Peribacteraceae bacterium]|nr:hypothetical protein [Candidatus Peribacteraceae bacterium]
LQVTGTGATPLIYADAGNGNVGIGTDSPSKTLDVNGSITAKTYYAINGAYYGTQFGSRNVYGSDTVIATYSGTNILFKIDSTEKMRIDQAGNVGIGDSTPSYPLDITIGATDTRGLNINGTTNDFTGTGSDTVYNMYLARDLNAGDGNEPTSFYNLRSVLYPKHTKADITNNSKINKSSFSYIGDTSTWENTGATNRAVSSFAGYNYINNDATLNSTGIGYINGVNYGVFNSIDTDATYSATGGATNYEFNYGAYSILNSNPTLSSGNLGVYNYGLYSHVTGTTVGSSSNYGLFINTVTGADNNYGIWDSSGANWALDGDSQKILWGEGQDASIYYDGTDLVIDPKEAGTGVVEILGDLTLTDYSATLKLDGQAAAGIDIDRGTTAYPGLLNFKTAGTGKWAFGMPDNATDDFMISTTGLIGNFVFYIDRTTKNIGIGTTSPTTALEVVGTISGSTLNASNDIRIDNTVMLGLPNQTDFLGTVFIGTGGSGASLVHSTGDEGRYNTFVGLGTGNATSTGSQNTGVGYKVLYNNTQGGYNTGNGFFSLYANTTGSSNTGNGSYSLRYNTTGNYNTGNGYASLYLNTTGSSNTGNGYQSLYYNTTGGNNTANGAYSLHYNTTGNYNTGNGSYSLRLNTTGSYLTAFGMNALYDNTEGSTNTAIGYNTGRGIVTGDNNTILGANVTGLAADLSNTIILADGAGNQRLYIDSSGDVGIGTSNPLAPLHVIGSMRSYLNGSDSRISGNLYMANAGHDRVASFQLSADGHLALWQFNGSSWSENIRVETDGNVGIGTTTPDTKLSVAGTMSGTSLQVTGTGAIPLIYANAGNGNVGIGTATPNAKLEISNTTGTILRVSSTQDSPSWGIGDIVNGIEFYSGDTSGGGAGVKTAIRTIVDGTTSGARQGLGFYTSNSVANDIERMKINGSTGNVGIGTGANLYAKNTIYTNDAFNNEAILINTDETTGTQNVFKIISDVASGNDAAFRITADGSTYSDNAYSSAGADYAEWFRTSSINAELQPGEVVCIDVAEANTVKRCEREADANIMGIVSTNPAFIGNSLGGAGELGIDIPGYALIGLIGQVPAKVVIEETPSSEGRGEENGTGVLLTIRPGDALTASSISGFARRALPGEPTVGVALEGFSGQAGDEGSVNVLISRRNSSITVDQVESEVLNQIAAMEIEDEVEIMIASAFAEIDLEGEVGEEFAMLIEELDIETTLEEMQETVENRMAQVENQLSLSGSTLSGSSLINTVAIISEQILSLQEVINTMSGAITTPSSYFDNAQYRKLQAQSLVITGSAFIMHDLTADTLHASAIETGNLTSSGTTVINGKLIFNGYEIDAEKISNIESRISKIGSGYIMDIGDLTLPNALLVQGDVTFESLARFMSNVIIRGDLTIAGTLTASGTLIVNKDQAGIAVVLQHGTGVTVNFENPYDLTQGKPIVTASSSSFEAWRIAQQTASGFTLELADPAPEDVTFTWHALATKDPKVTYGTVNGIQIVEFPVDENGVPLSSSEIWNSCIRQQAPLDLTGQPFNCSRYHDGDIWAHPDLIMEFIWDSEANPRLILPEGYRINEINEEDERNEENDIGTGDTHSTSSGSTTVDTGTGSTIDDGETDTGTGSTIDDGETDTGTGSTIDDGETDTGTGSTIDDGETDTGTGSIVDDGGDDTGGEAGANLDGDNAPPEL